MYVKHFLKMFIGLLFMAALGITGLVLANHYSQSATASMTGGATTTTSVTTNTTAITQ